MGDRFLQRFFSTFPGGWPGLGLLLLRLAIAASLLVPSARRFAAGADATVEIRVVAFIEIGAGMLLSIGLLTPPAGVVAALLAALCLVVPAVCAHGLNGVQAALSAIVLALALILLGPGAYSVDARLFGRREVVIPRASESFTDD